MQLTGAGNEPIRVANEGGESACDRLFAKIEQIALENGCADSKSGPGDRLISPAPGRFSPLGPQAFSFSNPVSISVRHAQCGRRGPIK